eukprot:tig00021612_g22881.t1
MRRERPERARRSRATRLQLAILRQLAIRLRAIHQLEHTRRPARQALATRRRPARQELATHLRPARQELAIHRPAFLAIPRGLLPTLRQALRQPPTLRPAQRMDPALRHLRTRPGSRQLCPRPRNTRPPCFPSLPMDRWVLKDKFWQWTSGDQKILDAYGREVLKGDGKFASFHDDTTFYDLAGNKVLRIMNRVFSLGSTYKIYNSQDQPVATQRRDVFNWPGTSISRVYRGNAHFKMNGDPENPTVNPLIYVVEGLLHSRFEIKNAATGLTVATVQRDAFNFKQLLNKNTFILECAPGVDALLMLAMTVIVEHEATKAQKD